MRLCSRRLKEAVTEELLGILFGIPGGLTAKEPAGHPKLFGAQALSPGQLVRLRSRDGSQIVSQFNRIASIKSM